MFAPGDGAAPPELAGRGTEQAVLLRCLADLADGCAPPHNIVLIGPRGNGKTVLLNWLKAACDESEYTVDVLTLTPHSVADLTALHDALIPRRGIVKLLPRKVGIASVGSAEWAQSGNGRKELAPALAARCQRRPLAVLLDEAHTLTPEVGSALLNASQQMRMRAPFLLVLAGTPGLRGRLNSMDASFWGRLGEGLLGIGRLSHAAARAALVKPLTARAVRLDDGALDIVVEYSQRYPYFIQLWGDALWKEHLATGTDRLTTATVATVQPTVAAQVADYYQGRFEELEASGLVPAAVAIARLFQDGMDATASNQDIDLALISAGLDDPADRFAAREGLNRLSYVWCPPGQQPPVVWSAGIPSLTSYVLAQAPESAMQPSRVAPRSEDLSRR